MELFRFITDPSDPTLLTQGILLPKVTSTQWIERYRDPGEFTITAPLYSGLHNLLPYNTCISHIDTLEVMIVEDIQIFDRKDDEARIEVTGRSLEKIMDQRVVGGNMDTDKPPQLYISDYGLAADEVWNQALLLGRDHYEQPYVDNADDEFPHIETVTIATGTDTPIYRIIERGDLHERMLELLAAKDCGIRVMRPSASTASWGISVNWTDTRFVIHNGRDLRTAVAFSWAAGDIEDAEYLWSIKPSKTDVYAATNFVETRNNTLKTGLNKRMMYVDAADIDSSFTDYPTGTDRTAVLNALKNRAADAIGRRNEVNLVRADISKRARFRYRQHYDIGDIVSINGNYGESAVARVVEFVEAEDENGYVGYPTLSIVA